MGGTEEKGMREVGREKGENGRDKGEGNVRSRKEKGGEKEGERYLLSAPKHDIS